MKNYLKNILKFLIVPVFFFIYNYFSMNYQIGAEFYIYITDWVLQNIFGYEVITVFTSIGYSIMLNIILQSAITLLLYKFIKDTYVSIGALFCFIIILLVVIYDVFF